MKWNELLLYGLMYFTRVLLHEYVCQGTGDVLYDLLHIQIHVMFSKGIPLEQYEISQTAG